MLLAGVGGTAVYTSSNSSVQEHESFCSSNTLDSISKRYLDGVRDVVTRDAHKPSIS